MTREIFYRENLSKGTKEHFHTFLEGVFGFVKTASNTGWKFQFVSEKETKEGDWTFYTVDFNLVSATGDQIDLRYTRNRFSSITGGRTTSITWWGKSFDSSSELGWKDFSTMKDFRYAILGK